jgi:hypothetical protein
VRTTNISARAVEKKIIQKNGVNHHLKKQALDRDACQYSKGRGTNHESGGRIARGLIAIKVEAVVDAMTVEAVVTAARVEALVTVVTMISASFMRSHCSWFAACLLDFENVPPIPGHVDVEVIQDIVLVREPYLEATEKLSGEQYSKMIPVVHCKLAL